MANYGVFGYVKATDGTIVTNAKVYPYFKKVSAAAPVSKWADTPYITSNLGYYSFNLGDNSLIGTESNIVKGTDKIYLAIVWNKNNVNDQDKNSLTFTHCLFIEHTTINEDFVEINLTIEPKRLPILDTLTFSSNSLLTRTNYTISEKSHADYTWKNLTPYNTNQISQKLNFDLVPIFDGHQMIDTIYDWGENIFNKPNSSNSMYQYQIAGIYNTCVTVREKWNTELKTCQQVTVKYNKPMPDFNWTPTVTNNWEGAKIKGTELITFTNLSSDIDNRTKDSLKWGLETYYYQWIITDTNLDGSSNTKTYSSKDWYFKPTHQFQSPGTKNITLNVFWNDGFADYVETITKQIIIEPFTIIPNFTWDKIPKHRNDSVTFTSNTTGDTNKIIKYNWIIEDNYPSPITDLYTFKSNETSIFGEGSPDNLIRLDNTYYKETIINNTSVKFHSTEVKTIKLIITYHNGWEEVQKEISKDLTPVKYSVTPVFTISNMNPKGRHELVKFNNTSSYLFDGTILAYSVDWKISDFYSLYNLDNATPGVIKDNTKIFLDSIYNEEKSHYFQNDDSNNVELTIRYDDGWQMQTKRLTKIVDPIVYTGIIPNFIFNTPESRFDEVQIENTTIDVDNRFRSLDYYITDKYNKFNPDNPNYRVAVTSNSRNVTADRYETVSHYFQDSTNETIELVYYYDDGFEEQSVSKIKTVNKIINDIIPKFTTNITPTNGGFLGKIEVIYLNISEELGVKIEDERWVFNDMKLSGEDLITERDDEIPFTPQAFTFLSPSRLPFSSKEFLDSGASKIQKFNKNVFMELRIDNGWRNDTELGSYLDINNAGDGGEVYFVVEKDFEATPNELESSITTSTNILNYSHD